MRYEIRSRGADVLESIAAQGMSEAHHPVAYVAYIDVSVLGRWASVECVCGSQNREWWLPETTTYLGLLITAWRSLTCSGAVSHLHEDGGECLCTEDRFL